MSAYYECVECQRLHYAPSYLYDFHIKHQSKNGIMSNDSPSETFSRWLVEHGAYSVNIIDAYRLTYTRDGEDWYAARIHPDDDVKFPPHWTIHKSGMSGPQAFYQKIYDEDVIS